jgi:hypothetical protein
MSGISTASFLFCEWISPGIEDAGLVGAEGDRYRFVEVLADHHPAICQAASKALSVDLKDHIFEFNRVVAVDDPFGLDRENLVEIATAARYKGRPFFA